MAFKKLVEEEQDSFDAKNLPWSDEWYKEASKPAEPKLVHWCKHYEKGIMVVTFAYKAYIHKGEKQYLHLKEALDVWLAECLYEEPLFCSLDKQGRPVLGIDAEQPKARWRSVEDKLVQVSSQPIAETLRKERANPLLAGRGVQQDAQAGEADITGNSSIKDELEGSRRRRKAG